MYMVNVYNVAFSCVSFMLSKANWHDFGSSLHFLMPLDYDAFFFVIFLINIIFYL